ncbi:hypothetical protein BS50DRAFT_455478, partial [Corynespora cassiicola Philippines]
PPHRALLLLPPPPAPPSYAALKAAYHAPLFTALRELARSPRRPSQATALDIALPCPHLYGQLGAPRGPLYATTHGLVADLYKLVCVIAANEAIDTEDADGVDARIVLVAYPRDGSLTQPPQDPTPDQEAQGPAVDLHTLARGYRSWDTLYAIESEGGAALLNNFLRLSPPAVAASTPVKRLRGGIVQVAAPPSDAPPAEQASALTSHRSVAVGGTFDHLHTGHKLLLTMFAFVLARSPSATDDQTPTAPTLTLTVGITGDALLKNKKHAEYLESWHDRQRAVHAFLSSLIYFGPPDDSRVRVDEITEPGPNGHAVHVTYPSGLTIKYVEIWDPFGPTITDESISALVISLETRSGGNAVNTRRAEKGWGPLDVFEVAVLDASEEESVDETFQSKLSSTEIRRMRAER